MNKELINSRVGVVVIGRNEGERLKKCLASVMTQAKSIVYVDSGSNDGSVNYAESLGVSVLQLDLSLPFSAARARNEGFEKLIELNKCIEFVQFIDGDCEMYSEWIDCGIGFLFSHPECAIVYGEVIERYPNASIYNWFCDIEWKTNIGECNYCGGIFIVRVMVFIENMGFNISMVAGEEPELCYRFRQKGWKIYHLGEKMVRHDAAMYYFVQWWKRRIRSGIAYIHGYYLHRNDKKPHELRENLRIFFWAFLIPVIIISSLFVLGPIGLTLLSVFPIQIIRLFFKMAQISDNKRKVFIYAVFTALEKIPQFYGQIIFLFKRLQNKKLSLIEYK